MQLLCTSSLLLTSSCTLRRVRKFYTVLSLPMSFLVAPHTKRYWILDHVIAQAAPRLNVMDLQTFHSPTGLARPAVSL